MKIHFAVDFLMMELVSRRNSEETGAFDLYFKRMDPGRPTLNEVKDTDLCPKYIVTLLQDYYFSCGSWPLTPEILLQWKEEETGRRFEPEEDREILAEKIGQLINLQKQARSLYIANFPEEFHILPYQLSDILPLLKELQSVQICENERGYFAKDGILYQTVSEGYVNAPEYFTALIFCPPDSPLTELRLDPSVKVIDWKAFRGNKNLVKLKAESEKIRIITFAFQGAESLETVKIRAEQVEILDRAFLNCPALKQFVIPRGSITFCSSTAFGPESAFYQALLAEWIEDSGYSGAPEDIAVFGRCGDQAWRYKDRADTEHVIGCGEMWDYEYYSSMKQSPHFDGKNLAIHEGITAVGTDAFCSNRFHTIHFAGSVREIRDCAFGESGCDTVTFPGTIRHLGTQLFYSDPCGVSKITISSEIEQIDVCAFLWRIGGPHEVVLTGEKPPADWIMWMRSELFSDKSTVVCFPEQWRSVMTPAYFEEIREKIRAAGLPEKSESSYSMESSYDFDIEDRIAFFDDMEEQLRRQEVKGDRGQSPVS